MDIELELTALVPDGVDFDRVFTAVADLVHGSEVPGVEVFCSGQNQELRVCVFIDPEYDPSWDETEERES
jgi:hypothetical protein